MAMRRCRIKGQRDRSLVIRHCERSEAIHSYEESVDCFVATLLGRKSLKNGVILPTSSLKLSSKAGRCLPPVPTRNDGVNVSCVARMKRSVIREDSIRLRYSPGLRFASSGLQKNRVL